MAIINALEELDPGLEIAQLLDREQSAAELPSHDQLYLEKAEETKEAEERKEDAASPTDEAPEEGTTEESISDGDSGEASVEEGEDAAGASNAEDTPGSEEINGKQTTVATEALRNDDYYNRFALESFGDETLLQKAGSAAWNGVKALSGFALHVATELGGFMKDLGIEYGPKIYAKLRSGVSYLLTRLFKSYMKMRSAIALAYFQNVHSFKKHDARLKRLRQILQDLPDNVKVTKQEPFSDLETFKLFQVGGQVSPMKSISSMSSLLDVIVSDIDQGIQNEIEVMKRVIEVCRHNTRLDVVHYLRITGLSSNFMKKTATGYDSNPELMDSYIYTHSLPRDTQLLASIPRQDIVLAAARTDDMTDVTKAYQESYLVLGVNQMTTKTIPLVNYMDKQSLLSLLDGLETVIAKAAKHVSFYKKLEEASATLKPQFRNYFSWLTEDEQAKTLRESLAEVLYLKQSFITKVYLPGAIDIHDFTSSYVAAVMRYVEKNIEVLKPADGGSPPDSVANP